MENITGSRDAYYQNVRSEVTCFLPDVYSRVLEVGCGEGNFRSNLKETCEYWGIEPSERAAEIATSRLDNVLVGKFEDLAFELPDRYFDLIICNDVIEHIPDHDQLLELLRQKLHDGGVVVGSVPNVRYWKCLFSLIFKKDWLYTDQGVLDRTHLRFFTEKSLKRTLEQHRFSILKFAYINGDKFKSLSPKNFLRRVFVRLVGADSRYRQFGFSVRKDADRRL